MPERLSLPAPRRPDDRPVRQPRRLLQPVADRVLLHGDRPGQRDPHLCGRAGGPGRGHGAHRRGHGAAHGGGHPGQPAGLLPPGAGRGRQSERAPGPLGAGGPRQAPAGDGGGSHGRPQRLGPELAIHPGKPARGPAAGGAAGHRLRDQRARGPGDHPLPVRRGRHLPLPAGDRPRYRRHAHAAGNGPGDLPVPHERGALGPAGLGAAAPLRLSPGERPPRRVPLRLPPGAPPVHLHYPHPGGGRTRPLPVPSSGGAAGRHGGPAHLEIPGRRGQPEHDPPCPEPLRVRQRRGQASRRGLPRAFPRLPGACGHQRRPSLYLDQQPLLPFVRCPSGGLGPRARAAAAGGPHPRRGGPGGPPPGQRDPH